MRMTDKDQYVHVAIQKTRETTIDKAFLKTSAYALTLALAVSPLALAADRKMSTPMPYSKSVRSA
jgi:hypothetical protein